MKRLYILVLLLFSLFGFIEEAKAQLPYIRPIYSINAGLDSAFCQTTCTNISRTATPLYENRIPTSYIIQKMGLPSPSYNTTGGTNVIVNEDDKWSAVVNIGFNFCFFGNSYNRLVIGANGIVSFNLAYANGICNWSFSGGIPDPSKPTNSIMGAYSDIDPRVSYSPNRINYYTEGTAPNRRFVINYNNIPLYSCNSLKHSSQIVLHEAYNIVDVIIMNKPVCTSWNGGRGIIGIQNASGTMAYADVNTNPSTALISNECWRFLPNGPLQQSINWTLNGVIVSNNAVLNTNVCPTSTTNYVANLSYQKCDGSIVTVRDDVNFTINQLPVADAGPDKVIGCLSNFVTIGTPAVAGNTYSWAPAPGLSATNIAQPNATTAGTYTITVTNTTTGCKITDVVNVTINKTPPVANAGPDKILKCTGELLGTAAVAGNTYSWSPASGLDDPTLARPTSTLPNTYILTVTNTTTGCSAKDTVIVTGNILKPAANAGSDKNLTCASTSFVIGSSAAANTSYAWSPAAGLDDATIAQPTVSAPGTYILTATHTISGCIAKDTVVITQDIVAPVADAGPAQTLTCTAAALTIGAAAVPGIQYAWSPAAGLNTPGIAQPTASSPGTYTLTATNPVNGCTATDQVIISQNITPPVSDAGPDKILTCAATSYVIGTAALPGVGYAWSPGAGLDVTNIARPTVSAPGNYTVTATNLSNGCTSSDQVNITQDITPPAANAGADQTLTCATTSYIIGTAAVPGINYSWSPAAGLSVANIAQPTVTAAGTYTLTATNPVNGCTATDQIIISKNTTAPIADAGVSQTLTCLNTSLTIGTPAVPGIQYAWSPSTGLNLTNIAQPTATLPGTFTLTATDPSNGCTATDQLIILQSISAPVANAGGDKILTCVKTSHVIGAAGVAGIDYSWSPAAGLDFTNIAQPTVTAPGTYTLTAFNPVNGCSSTDQVTITQNTVVPSANAGPDKILTCADTAHVLGVTSIASINYSWSPATGLDATNIAQPTATRPGTFTVKATDPVNGCFSTDQVVVTQNITPPVADAGVNKVLTCRNTSYTIGTAGVAGISYAWTPIAGLDNALLAQPVVSEPGTYTVTATNPVNGCTASDQIIIFISNAAPIANAGNPKTITCALTSVSIGSAPGSGMQYSWTPSAGLNADTIAQPTAYQPGTYTITVTDTSNGCFTSDQVVVAKNITPPVANAGANQTLTCAVTSVTLGVAAVPGINYSWTAAAGLSATNIAQPSTTAPGTFTIKATDPVNGCTATDNVLIAQDTTPPVVNAGLDQTLTCADTAFTIGGATAVAGMNYVWTPATGLSDDSIAQTIVTAPATYTLTVTNPVNGCVRKDQVVITKNVTPPGANAGIDKTLTCKNTSYKLGTIAVPGIHYSWTPSGGLNDDTLAQPVVTEPDTYTLTTTSSVNGCSSKDVVVVSKNITPPVVDAGPDQTLTCTVESRVLGTEAIPGIQYAWTPVTGINTASIAQPTVTEAGTYTVTATDPVNGCKASDEAAITIYKPYTLIDLGEDTTIFQEEAIVLKELGAAAGTYAWTPGNSLSCSTCTNPVAIPLTTTTYNLALTNADGCVSKDSMTINVIPVIGLFFPTAFSPNNDGANDFFLAMGDSVRSYEIHMYNRWGEEVFTTKDITSGWDGFFHDTEQPMDTYVYNVNAILNNRKHKNYIGTVVLLR